MDDIQIYGGGDCHELSLSGLQAGLKYALPNSIAYVISDATAKDHDKFRETHNLMQKKQTKASTKLKYYQSSILIQIS